MNYFYSLVTIISCLIAYRLGRKHGIDETLEYFKNHPIPEEWIERK